jgi:hypothetical protein
MKSLFTLVLMIIAIVGFAQSSERKITSTVKEVTVFLQGAQVTRTAAVELKPGPTTLILNGTSPRIQENSIQVESNQGVKILGASFRVNYLRDLRQSDEGEGIQKEINRLSGVLHDEKTALKIFDEEEAMLKSNKVIGGSMKGVDINELKVAVDYFRQRMMDIRSHRLEIEARINGYEKEVARFEAMKSELKVTPPRPEGEIVVKLESKSDVRAQLKVSYLVNEASWFPLYDIRAKDIQSPVAITYKANITQQSGEDWENVKLTVSSADPNSTGSRPDVKPWILGFNNGTESSLQGRIMGIQSTGPSMISGQVIGSGGKPLPGVNILIKGTSIGTVSDANGYYSIAIAPNNGSLIASFIGMEAQEVKINGQSQVNIMMLEDVTELQEVVVTGYATQSRRDITGSVTTVKGTPRIKQTIAATPVVRTTNVEFTLDNPYTIKTGGESQTVDMIEYEVDAQYQYYSAPKFDTDAFLTARMTDWDSYNFLEGQASIFFEGKYIGKTILDTRNTSDTLTLSLGRDKNVVVTREKVKDYSSNQFVGSNRKSLLAYEISVRNKKAYPIDIRIEDQLPVPNTKEITVDNLEDTDAIKDEAKGLLTWNLKVEPGKAEKINLRYEIRYPKFHNIILE